MGAIQKTLKYEILIAKLLGLAFFSFHLHKSTRLYDYFFCLPYILIYTICLIHSVNVFNENYVKSTYLITLMEILLFRATVLCQYLLPVYYLAHRKIIKELLIEIDEYSTVIDFNKESKNFINTKLFLWGNVIIITTTLIYKLCTKFTYYIAYELPINMLLFQQYWIYKILDETRTLIEEFNWFLQLQLSSGSDKMDFLLYKELYRKFLSLTKRINEIFGLPILFNLLLVLLCLIAMVQHSQYLVINNLETTILCFNLVWLLTISFRLYYTVNCWTLLNKKVSKFLLVRYHYEQIYMVLFDKT